MITLLHSNYIGTDISLSPSPSARPPVCDSLGSNILDKGANNVKKFVTWMLNVEAVLGLDNCFIMRTAIYNSLYKVKINVLYCYQISN